MPSLNLPLPQINNRYRLDQLIGEGGMGEVYRAYDRLTGQTVALKRVTARAATLQFQSRTDPASFRKALAREFKVLASLRHPHIVSVLDYGFERKSADMGETATPETRNKAVGLPFYTMSFLENMKPLDEAARPLALPDRIELILQLLQALAYLHRRGILHRDLKPDNVLVDAAGMVKVVDFGLAVERDDATEVEGTLAYMAPEVLQGRGATPATDLFAVGVMLFEIVTGRHPFNTVSVSELLTEILDAPPDVALFDSSLREQAPLPPAAALSPAALHDVTITADDFPANPSTDVTIIEAASFDLPISSPASPIVPPSLAAYHPLTRVMARLMAKDPLARHPSAEAALVEICAAMGREIPPETTAIRESFLVAAKFIGRAGELEKLTHALYALPTGQGSQWLIGGESGIGKSRLLDEIRIQAMIEGVRTLHGQGVQGGGLPYQLWRDVVRRLILSTDLSDFEAGILREIVPDIESLIGRVIPNVTVLEGKTAQQRLTFTILDLFKRQQGPLLLLLEDIHWARESLDLLSALSPIALDRPWLIIASFRDDEKPDIPAQLPQLQLLKLSRLNTDEMASLSTAMLGEVGALPQVVHLLQRETEGNTLFMIEVVRALATEAGMLSNIGKITLPRAVFAGGVRRILEQRLARIPSWGQTALRHAALLGRHLDLPPLKATNPHLDWEHWLLVCADGAVLEVADGGWRFAHDRLREAVLQGIPATERPSLHGQIALALEQAYGPRLDYAEAIAEHAYHGGDLARTFQYTLKAAAHMIAITADYPRAENLLSRALQLADDNPAYSLERARFLHQMGESGNKSGRLAEAVDHYEAALALNPHDPMLEISILNGLSHASWQLGNYAVARQYAQSAYEKAQHIGDAEGLSRAYYNLGVLELYNGDFPASRDYFLQGLAIAKQRHDGVMIASSYNNLGIIANNMAEFEVGREYLEKSLAIRRANGDRRGIASALINLGVLAINQRWLDDAVRYFEQSLPLCQEVGHRFGVALSLSNLGIIARTHQDYDTALDHFLQSAKICQEIGNRQALAERLNEIALTHLDRNKPQRARRYLREAFEIGVEIQALPTLITSVGLLARLYVMEENFVEAARLMGVVENASVIEASLRRDFINQLRGPIDAALSADEIEALTAAGQPVDLVTFGRALLMALADDGSPTAEF